jgi:predicted anti-sigma-YlaC factor YlaD
MKYHKPHKDIMNYAEGLLSQGEILAVEKHLGECETCSSFYNEVKAVLGVIEAEKAVDENPFFFTRVETRMLQPDRVPAFAIRRLVPTIVALLFFAGGVYAGINIGRLYENGGKSNEMLVFEAKRYIDDLSQEPIESFIINLFSDSDDTK